MGSPRKEMKDYHELAASKGFEWLGSVVFTVKTKTKWGCGKDKEHTWYATYTNIQQGRGCPHCSSKVVKISQDYHDLATNKEYTWLGPFVKYVSQKTKWRCDKDKNHTWYTTYSNIQNGRGCPHCYGNFPRTLEDFYTLAAKKGFDFLGPFPGNSRIKTKWKCSKGHEWPTTYSSIRSDTGCPYCILFKGPEKIAGVLETLGIYYECEKRFDDCKNKKHLPFDFYFSLNDKRYLIEYQGGQHYQAVDIWKGEQGLRDQQKRDAIKAQWARDNGYNLIVIPYTQFENIEQIIKRVINPGQASMAKMFASL